MMLTATTTIAATNNIQFFFNVGNKKMGRIYIIYMIQPLAAFFALRAAIFRAARAAFNPYKFFAPLGIFIIYKP